MHARIYTYIYIYIYIHTYIHTHKTHMDKCMHDDACMHRFVLFTYAHARTQAATSRHAKLEGHQGLVWCVAASGDGTIIVSCDSDGTLKVWGRDNCECKFTVTKAHGGVPVAAIDIR